MSGYWRPVVEPTRTDPHLDLTAADVLAWAAQQREIAGRPVTLTPETVAAAEAYAQLMLGVIDATPIGDQP